MHCQNHADHLDEPTKKENEEYEANNEVGELKITYATDKENRIYIRGEFTKKKCKTTILLYCFHTAGVLHIFVLYNLLGHRTSFYRKSKTIVKRKPNYEIGWFYI